MTGFRHDATGTPAAAWRAHPARSSLPALDLPADLERLVVVAAHPDDESLGAGGLLATAHARGLAVDLVTLTAGEASHPRSTTHPPERLRGLREAEAEEALRVLSPTAVLHLAGLPDGAVADHEDAVVRRLVALVGDGRHTLLVAPWQGDGHPDHEATGRAAATAAARTGATCAEYPVWLWHWGDPATAPWPDLVALDLDAPTQELKQRAVLSHRSQVEPLSPEPGDEVLLAPTLLEHFTGPLEVFVRRRPHDTALDELHREAEEPWGADRRWYEQRKRALLGAVLPRPTFARTLEVGCSTGVLAADLARRSDVLVAVDNSPAAVERAVERLRDQPHADVRRLDVPDDWPEGRFDLVVVSEVGYFLSPPALDRLVERVRGSLTDDGVVVLCHWRHEVVGWPLDGPDVHARFVAAGVRPVAATYRDRDVEVLLLAADDRLPEPGR